MTEPDGAGPVSGWRPPDAPPTFPTTAPAWPPSADANPARSTSLLVVAAAVFLLILGILTFGMGTLLLLAALLAGAGSVEGVPGDVAASLGGFVAGFALLVIAWAVLEIVASIGMLGHRRWGRLLGLAIGGLGLAFAGLSLVTALGAGDAGGGPSVGFNAALVAGYGLTVLALATGEAHFRRP